MEAGLCRICTSESAAAGQGTAVHIVDNILVIATPHKVGSRYPLKRLFTGGQKGQCHSYSHFHLG